MISPRLLTWHALASVAALTLLPSSLAFAASISLHWTPVERITYYRVERKVDTQWLNLTPTPVANTTFNEENVPEGEHTYRVSACFEQPNVTIHCGDKVAQYKEATFTLTDTPQRQVIFIHTDLLGSPAAQSNEQGVWQ